jgi:hypothetical protein
MGLRKWVISEDKLRKLEQSGVYTICCKVDDCPCENKSSVCPRGFFSLFIQAIYGIELATHYGASYYVDFGNCTYLYSDPKSIDQNFWNYYFQQPTISPSLTNRLVPNSFAEVYPLRIWKRQHLVKMNQKVVSKLLFKDELERKLEQKRTFFRQYKVLGVQIRRTDHGNEVAQISLNEIFKKIKDRIRDFDYLFVATDDQNVFRHLETVHGAKLIPNEVVRSENNKAVHSNLEIKDRYNLGEQVLIDCYCLSLCAHSILIQSNISYAALLFNPDLPYTLLERGNYFQKFKRLIQKYSGK